MTKRDFFVVILKLFGISLLLTFLTEILPYVYQIEWREWEPGMIWAEIFMILLYLGLSLSLIFNTSSIINILKLDRGFEENRIELGQLCASDVIKLGSFIMGGWLIIHQFGLFVNYAFNAFMRTEAGMEVGTSDYFEWSLSFIKLVIGFLLITKYNYIANKFMSKSEDEKTKE